MGNVYENNFIDNSISKEYISKINELIKFSIEVSNILIDSIFNVKISLSILKGGISDFQKGNISTDIYKEIKSIRDNLSASSRLVIRSKSKLNSITISNNEIFSIENEHFKMINNFVDVLDKFLNTFQEKIITTEFCLMDEIEKVGLKNAQEEFVQDWHSRFFSINNTGFNIIKSSRDNTNKMIEHLELYKQNIKNERRINEILKELKMGEIIGEEVKKIELSYITPNSVIARDLYSETGAKLKSAYETITEEDLAKFKKNNIKNLYFDNPITKELNPSDYRIVAIDDSIVVTTMIKNWLEEFGFKIKIYNEPLKALVDILRDDFPDLMLLDIKMPDMDGFTFLENFKTLQKGQLRLPIIIITAITGESYIRRAINLGAVDYHIKPLNKELLLKKIFHTLSLSESSKNKK